MYPAHWFHGRGSEQAERYRHEQPREMRLRDGAVVHAEQTRRFIAETETEDADAALR